LISAKLLVLFYVDPDGGGINTHVDEALKAEKYGMVASLIWLQTGFLML
jgi:hypothetical protein